MSIICCIYITIDENIYTAPPILCSLKKKHIILNIVVLLRENKALLFLHLNTLMLMYLLLLLLLRDVIWCSIYMFINCNINATNNGHILCRQILILTWWQNRNVALFVDPTNLILFPNDINWLHGIPMASRHLQRTKNNLLRNLLFTMNINPCGK